MRGRHSPQGRRPRFRLSSSGHFQFETRSVSNHTACRFAEKARFFRSLWAGRRCAAASRFIFFKVETLPILPFLLPAKRVGANFHRDPAYIALRRTFQVWLGRVVFKRSGMTDEIPEFRDLDEVDAMLEERAAQWKDEYIRQGLVLGEASGELKRGRAVLLALLRDRFGALPQEVESAVHVLDDADQLMELTLAVYRSNSLESFFSRLHAAFGNQRQ